MVALVLIQPEVYTFGDIIHVLTNFVAEINECITGTPCLNGGVCSNTAGSFTCNCSGTGYQGDTCQNGKYH